jgi:type I restriction enzyme S subunit
MVEGFKHTEVGFIPNDWEIKELRDICDITSSKRIFESDYVNIGVPFYRGKEISLLNENKKLEEEYFISEEKYEAIKKTFGAPTKGDILITAVGTLGNVYFVPNNDRFYFKDGNLIWLRNIKNVLPSYFSIQLNWLRKEIINNAIGSSQKALTIVVLKKQFIPLPPTKAEQTAIATALNDTDALIQKLEHLIAKKRNIKTGAMQELLKPKEGWEVKKLGEIGDFKNGINKNNEDFGFGFPFVNLLDVFGKSKISSNTHLGLINANDNDRKIYDLREGDVLFILSSVKPEGVGLTVLIDKKLEETVFSGFIIRFRDRGYLSKEFKNHCFHSEDFRKRLISKSSVSANTNISQDALKNLDLSYPKDKTEQTHIAQILSDMDNEIQELEKQLEKYKMMKQGMMQSLLTGKIRLV